MSAAVCTTPLPSAFATATFRRARPAGARHAERRVRAQLERVAEVVVEAAQDDVDAVEAPERLEVDAALAHREVAPSTSM